MSDFDASAPSLPFPLSLPLPSPSSSFSPSLPPSPSSTITQYEYYSPYSPDGVPKMFGTPPRIVFTQYSRETAFHNVFLNITRFAYCFCYTQDSRETLFQMCF